MTKSRDGIVSEIDERIAAANAEPQFEASGCKKMTATPTPKTAGVLTDMSEREVFRLIEKETESFCREFTGAVWIDSLRDLHTNSNTPHS